MISTGWVQRVLGLVFSGMLASCDNLSKVVDDAAFRNFGGTVTTSPQQISLKQIHLDNGTLLGTAVIVEGKVDLIGEHNTHLVIKDENSRMLVVLNNLMSEFDPGMAPKDSTLRVLGTVERGKMGLPFVVARALKRVDNP